MRYLTLIVALLVSTLAYAATPLAEAWGPYADRIQAVIDNVPDHPTDAQIEQAKAEARIIGEEFAAEWKGKELAITGYARVNRGPTWQVEYMLIADRELRHYGDMLLATRASPRELAYFEQQKAVAGAPPVNIKAIASRRPFPIHGIVSGAETRKPTNAGEGSRTDMVGNARLIIAGAFIAKDAVGKVAAGEVRSTREVVGYPTIDVTIDQ